MTLNNNEDFNKIESPGLYKVNLERLNMTDKEIITALRCCSAESLAQKKCKQCPYHKRSSVQCIGRLCKDALELIERQQTEKER